jgi:hypothetical protein
MKFDWAEKTRQELGERAREKEIEQTQKLHREKTMIGQVKIDVEKVGGEAQKTKTRKRGLGRADCGE